MGQAMLGTMTFGDTVDADTACSMVDAALEMGIDHVDTANVYTGGEAERILGAVLAGRRDDVTVATKVGMPHADAGEDAPLSSAAIGRCVEGSLGRLGTDHVDLLYLHQPDRSTPIDETLAAVADLLEQGKVLSYGLSNYSAWMTRDVAHAAETAGMPLPAAAQQLLNLLARRLEEEYLEMALVSGMRTVVYNPLSGGLLTGRHDFDQRPSTGRFGDSRLAAMYQDRYWSPGIFDAIVAYRRIADEAGLTLLELSLRWVGWSSRCRRRTDRRIEASTTSATNARVARRRAAARRCRRRVRCRRRDVARSDARLPSLMSAHRNASRDADACSPTAGRVLVRPRCAGGDRTDRSARDSTTSPIDMQHGLVGYDGLVRALTAVDAGGSARWSRAGRRQLEPRDRACTRRRSGRHHRSARRRRRRRDARRRGRAVHRRAAVVRPDAGGLTDRTDTGRGRRGSRSDRHDRDAGRPGARRGHLPGARRGWPLRRSVRSSVGAGRIDLDRPGGG